MRPRFMIEKVKCGPFDTSRLGRTTEGSDSLYLGLLQSFLVPVALLHFGYAIAMNRTGFVDFQKQKSVVREKTTSRNGNAMHMDLCCSTGLSVWNLTKRRAYFSVFNAAGTVQLTNNIIRLFRFDVIILNKLNIWVFLTEYLKSKYVS